MQQDNEPDGADTNSAADGTQPSPYRNFSGSDTSIMIRNSGSGDEEKVQWAASAPHDDALPVRDAQQEAKSDANTGYHRSMETLSTHHDLPGYVKRHRNDLTFPEKVCFVLVTPMSFPDLLLLPLQS
jgi:hypothetical protein